jgi:HAD superfamily hydrolase (TIGR01458 family)
MKLCNHEIRGVLLDIEGVLCEGAQVIAGAGAALQRLRAQAIPYRLLTNTTTVSRDTYAQRLCRIGLDVRPEELSTAPRAACAYMAEQGLVPEVLLVRDEVAVDLVPAIRTPKGTAVVIGDLGDAWSYARMNEAFQALRGGAALIALHKNKYWQSAGQLQLDIGAFVAGLEYASGREAIVVGKPNEAFFIAAANELQLPPEQLLVVGDDVESDIGGAQRSGMLGALVRTGKYRPELVKRSGIEPSLVLDSIADLSLLV